MPFTNQWLVAKNALGSSMPLGPSTTTGCHLRRRALQEGIPEIRKQTVTQNVIVFNDRNLSSAPSQVHACSLLVVHDIFKNKHPIKPECAVNDHQSTDIYKNPFHRIYKWSAGNFQQHVVRQLHSSDYNPLEMFSALGFAQHLWFSRGNALGGSPISEEQNQVRRTLLRLSWRNWSCFHLGPNMSFFQSLRDNERCKICAITQHQATSSSLGSSWPTEYKHKIVWTQNLQRYKLLQIRPTTGIYDISKTQASLRSNRC